MRSLRIAAVFILFSVLIFTPIVAQDAKQETNVQDVEKETGVRVAKDNKDTVVTIETTMHLENGEVWASGGSGFFWDKEGHVATVSHVVKEKDDMMVVQDFFSSRKVKIVKYEYYAILASKKRKYKAELVGPDLNGDTALLKVIDIDPNDYNAAKIGDPDKLKVGESLYAIGSPYGFDNTFTAGKVSALHRYVNYWYLEDFIQTDCPINPGNSGCPLFNSQGEVVGLADLGIRSADGMSFAVSIKLFNFEQLKKGEVELPWFGAEALVENFYRMGTVDKPWFQDLKVLYELTGIDDPESLILLAKLTYPTFKDGECWAIVTMVEETKTDEKYAPAKTAGLKRGDLIMKVNGKSIKSGMDLRLAVSQKRAGDTVELEIIRIEKNVAKTMTIKVTLQKKPKN